MKIGILPVGGESARWSGFPKELLPLGNAWTLLDRALLTQTRALVDHVFLVSSPAKYDLHYWWVKDHMKWPNVDVLLADSVKDAILIVLKRQPADEYIFGFPDVYSDNPLYPEELTDPLEMGLFRTDASEKMGMMRGDLETAHIVDKQPGPPGKAYGAFMFDRKVAQFWLGHEFEDHTDMLNQALAVFDWGSWPIETYVDVASFNDYLGLLGGTYAKK